MDVTSRHSTPVWRYVMGSIVRNMGATSYTPLLVRRYNESEQFFPVTYGLSQFEYAFGDPSHIKRIICVTKVWTEAHRICSSQHARDDTHEYLEWRIRRFKYANLPPIDETVQPADTQLKKVFTEAEILKQEFQRERHRWEMDVSKL